MAAQLFLVVKELNWRDGVFIRFIARGELELFNKSAKPLRFFRVEIHVKYAIRIRSLILVKKPEFVALAAEKKFALRKLCLN